MEKLVDTGLSLLMKEVDIHMAALSTYRTNLTTSISIALTLDAILAASAIDKGAYTEAKFLTIVAIGATLAMVAIGLVLLRSRKDLLVWPNGLGIGNLPAAEADALKELLLQLDANLKSFREKVSKLQWRIGLMFAAVCISVVAWLICLSAVPNLSSNHGNEQSPSTSVVAPATTG